MSAVRLVSRDGEKWSEVAKEKIDGPDIEERLMAMVDMVEPGAPVTLFLPRDQILYAEVDVSSEEAAQSEIDAHLEERTPYKIDELVVDWLFVATDRTKVAAIAKETLDEAAAFAEARGLKIANYGSLADQADFPRNPNFRIAVGPLATEAPVETTGTKQSDLEPAQDSPTFASSRHASPHDSDSGAATRNGPVIRVDDDRPVMEIAAKPLPPLDPGQPINQVQQPPRVRTDVASDSASGAVASLNASSGPIKVHTGQNRPKQTLIAFGVAAALTIGIAAVVWSVLPLAPKNDDAGAVAPVETGEVDNNIEVAEEALVTTSPDLPQPSDVFQVVSPLGDASNTAEAVPSLPKIAQVGFDRSGPGILATMSPGTEFSKKAALPLEKTPEGLAQALMVAPSQGLDGTEDASETTLDIYFASVERGGLASDAIALPSVAGLLVGALPLVTGPPSGVETAPDAKFVRVEPREAPRETPSAAQDAETPSATRDTEPTSEPSEFALAPQILIPEPNAPVITPGDAVEPSSELSEDETSPVAEEPTTALQATRLAAGLPDRKPPARPQKFIESIERERFGGRTRSELSSILPPQRPASPQRLAREDRPNTAASTLAVGTSSAPRARPEDFDALVATTILQAREQRSAAQAEITAPDTTAAVQAALEGEDEEPGTRPQDSPRLALPSNASVSRQATVEDALRLNRINLVGVYGIPSDRRALVRLPSGRYIKVKVGDRVDGGTVAQINDDELLYRKGNRTVSLSMPQG